MSLVKILFGDASEKPPETLLMNAPVCLNLWNNFHLGCVREKGESCLGALLRPTAADVAVLSAVALPHRVSVQGAFVAIEPGTSEKNSIKGKQKLSKDQIMGFL